ncbi:hypothetical protein Tco_0189327 [Tanacetum coccineum]
MPISIPTSSPPLLLPSASRREDRPEVTLPPQKRLGIALGPRYEVGKSSSAVTARPAGGLRITDSWDEIVETLQGAPVSTDTELGRHMTAFETRVRQDTDEVYTRLDDEQSQRQLLADRLNMLFRDRRAMHIHRNYRTGSEVKRLRVAYVDRSRQAVTIRMLKADHRRSAEMRELRTADHTRQQQLIQTLTVMQSLQREHYRDMLPHYRDSKDPLEVLRSQSCQRKLVAVHRLDHVMIDQGVTTALAARDANRNGDDSHTSGTGGRRTERICVKDFPEESDKIERYVDGLPKMIHGNIIASKPKTMQEAVEMATKLMDKKVTTIAEIQADNKRKFENTSRNNQNQQQQNKRQNTGRAYTTGTSEKKHNGDLKPL